MATVTAPRKRPNSRRRWWIIGAIVAVLVIVGIIASTMLGGAAAQQPGETPGWTTVDVTTGAIEASVGATGNVAPQAQADVRFVTDGVVTEILVKPGDQVSANQPLAKLEQIDAQLKLTAAQADFELAQAGFDKLKSGSTAEEIKEAQAKLAQAQAQYQQTLAKFSNADIAAARARLEEAQVRLNALRASAKSTDVRDAEAGLQRAQLALQSERDRLSQAKTNAQLGLDRAVADLSRVQQNYATAKGNWEFVQETGNDPTNPSSPNPAKPGERIPNKLNDTQRQQYYDTFVSAEAALRSSEASVEQARVEFDTSRQSEVTGIQTAEQQVASAQAALDKVRNSEPAQIAEARAAVASAQADLNRLVGDSRSSDLASAQASLDSAQLALDKVMQGATTYDLVKAQSDVVRADTALKQAERAMAQTILTAPFDATVARIDLRIGEQSASSGIVALVDMRSFHVDIPIDELDIAQIQSGQAARIVLDALPGNEMTGRVTTISPLAVKSDRGTNTYAVTVELDSTDGAVKPGMTATIRLITTRKEGVVLVPRRAIQTENGQSFVYVPSAVPQAPQSTAPGATPTPPGERRVVTLGLSNSEQVEVLSGLQAGDKVYVPDVVQTFNPFANQ
jgi:RND family efflux transporter MFP subunit